MTYWDLNEGFVGVHSVGQKKKPCIEYKDSLDRPPIIRPVGNPLVIVKN